MRSRSLWRPKRLPAPPPVEKGDRTAHSQRLSQTFQRQRSCPLFKRANDGAPREYNLRTTTDDVVAALGHALCQRIGAPRYDLWFRAKTKFRLDPAGLRVGVPNRFFQEWLQKTFT